MGAWTWWLVGQQFIDHEENAMPELSIQRKPGRRGPANLDVAVIGGGLAGLTAALYLARAGLAVTLFERSASLGGRARTRTHDDFLFNLGPHALYRGGAAARILRDLGINWSGGSPPFSGQLLHAGATHPLPGNPLTLFTSSLFTPVEKLELTRLLAELVWRDPTSLDQTPLGAWLEQVTPHAAVRRLLAALVRTSCYTADTEHVSAGAALAQTRLALRHSVAYLDGGWQTLVDGLRQAATRAGVTICTDQPVLKVRRATDTGAVHGLELADQAYHPVTGVVIATSPREALKLVEGGERSTLQAWADESVPVQVASLDLALREVPRPAASIVLGLDQPLYFSVHSGVARLAPDGAGLLHVAKYLSISSTEEPVAIEQELEALLDSAQPGWREVVITRRFLPRLTVSHRLVMARHGGLAGRPGPAVPGIAGLWVAGDWVGSTGLLADAALASGRQAANLIIGTINRVEQVSTA